MSISRTDPFPPNALNQYTQRTVPGTNDVIGVAIATNAVTVNGVTAYRKGEYFRGLAGTNNSAVAEWVGVTVSTAGNNQSGNVFVPRTPEQFQYDADGNLTSDGRWDYTWDAENRLTKVESKSGAPAASKRRVSWECDGKGRRIQQTTYAWTNGAYSATEDLKFISDPASTGRHFAELNATNNALIRSYVWGLDLSGSMDGAGGVGGLLMLNSVANGTHFYGYDGNGNVSALVKASDGTVSANYEYGPFGEVIRATGAMADENRFQFSTKRCDRTTDFNLYEYRVRRADISWLSRDPIGEKGGLCLYNFTGNDSLDRFDALGLTCKCGKDITHTIRRTLLLVAMQFYGWQPYQKNTACAYVIDWFYGPSAWDMLDTRSTGGADPPCVDSATFNDRCYQGNAIAYSLWGKICALCYEHFMDQEDSQRARSFTKLEATRRAAFFKQAVYGDSIDVDQAILFTAYGYDGTLPYALETPNCSKNTTRTERRDFGWCWEPYRSCYRPD